jgi:26S proteasome regulatory subunit N5
MSKQKAEDFSDLVKEKIPEYTTLSETNFGQSIENLLQLEKKTRQGGDTFSTGKVLVAIVDVCQSRKQYQSLNENLVLLSKRRGLIKEAVKQMTQRAQAILTNEKEPLDYNVKMDLITTIMAITDGKIYLEKPRARVVLLLSKIREDEGKIDEAAKILQDVQVETFGTMKIKEKTEYILEQMRLCLKKKDFVRAQIISKKINPKVFEAEDMDALRIRFNQQMISYYLDAKKYLEVAKCYWEIFETVKTEEEKLEYLKLLVIFVILSTHNNEQSDFINRVNQLPLLEKLPEFKSLVTLVLTIEVIVYHSLLEKVNSLFLDNTLLKQVFKDKEGLDLFWEEFSLRIIEHNIRVIEKYYKRVTTSRLASLLSLNEKETEVHLGRMVVAGAVYAKIDRPHGIVSFRKAQTASDQLNQWSSDIDSLLKIVENSCHLIERENMIYKLNV